MSLLFSPLTIRGLQLKNRIMVSPMCQYSSVDGFANDWHLVHLGTRATGGAAIVMQEATAVVAEGRISPEDAGLYREEHIEKWKQITTFIRSQGAIPAIQLAHAGRKASVASPWKGNRQLSEADGGWQTVAPSAIAFHEGDAKPTALSVEEIKKLVESFATAAKRALQAGYELIEIHAAHGYLIHEFMSPLANKRDDLYGGNFENRIRFLCEIVEATRSVIPETMPLFVRISASDWTEDGWTPEDSAQLAPILQRLGVDLIDCSSGGIIPRVHIPTGPGYQVPFAEKIKKETGVLAGAVGMITTAEQAEEILQQQQADLIIMARQLLREPYFPLHAAAKLGDEVEWPVQYGRGK